METGGRTYSSWLQSLLSWVAPLLRREIVNYPFGEVCRVELIVIVPLGCELALQFHNAAQRVGGGFLQALHISQLLHPQDGCQGVVPGDPGRFGLEAGHFPGANGGQDKDHRQYQDHFNQGEPFTLHWAFAYLRCWRCLSALLAAKTASPGAPPIAPHSAAFPADFRSVTPKTFPTLRAALTSARSLGPDGAAPPPAITGGAPPGPPAAAPLAADAAAPAPLAAAPATAAPPRSEEHTSELQSLKH